MRRALVVLALLACTALSACTNDGTGAQSVVGTWTLTQVVQPDGTKVAIPANVGAVIALGDVRDASGRDGTNQFGGHYERAGDTLRFTDVSSTLVGLLDTAPAPLRAAQAAFHAILSGQKVMLVRGGSTLTLTVSGYIATFALKA